MICKPPSWPVTGLYFIFMVACYLGFSALLPSIRHQMSSLHSSFWSFDFPSSLVSLSIIALALRYFPIVAARLRQRHSSRAS
ncbi:MAG TPA: hypothetical protein VME68_06555 [Acidobacteriaceae bacterium]|nr:hypothetical protein [Acidobacteriaceae bacterium]